MNYKLYFKDFTLVYFENLFNHLGFFPLQQLASGPSE